MAQRPSLSFGLSRLLLSALLLALLCLSSPAAGQTSSSSSSSSVPPPAAPESSSPALAFSAASSAASPSPASSASSSPAVESSSSHSAISPPPTAPVSSASSAGSVGAESGSSSGGGGGVASSASASLAALASSSSATPIVNAAFTVYFQYDLTQRGTAFLQGVLSYDPTQSYMRNGQLGYPLTAITAVFLVSNADDGTSIEYDVTGVSSFTPGENEDSFSAASAYDNLIFPVASVPLTSPLYVSTTGWQLELAAGNRNAGSLLWLFTETLANGTLGSIVYQQENLSVAPYPGAFTLSSPQSGGSSLPTSAAFSSASSASSASELAATSSSSFSSSSARPVPSSSSSSSSSSTGGATVEADPCSILVTFNSPYFANSAGALLQATFTYDLARPYPQFDTTQQNGPTGYSLLSIAGTVTFPTSAPYLGRYLITGLSPVNASGPLTHSASLRPYDNLYYPAVHGNSYSNVDDYGWQFVIRSGDGTPQLVNLHYDEQLAYLNWDVDGSTGSAVGGVLYSTCEFVPISANVTAPHLLPFYGYLLLINDVADGGSSLVIASLPLTFDGDAFVPLPRGSFPAQLSQFAAASATSSSGGSTAAVVVGGFDSSTQTLSNAVWVSQDGTDWQLLAQPSYSIFSPRSHAGLVALVSAASTTPQPVRGLSLLHAAVAAASTTRPTGTAPLVLLGGSTGESTSDVANDVWISVDQAVTWSQLTDAAAFSARSGMAVVVEAGAQCAAGCLLVVGGQDSTGTALNDVWLSSDSARTFRQLTSAAAFQGRMGAQLAVSSNPATSPIYEQSTTLPSSLLVLAGGVGSFGSPTTDASAWLSYDGGWTWLPLLPAPSSSFPFSFASAAPYFDAAVPVYPLGTSISELVFLGVRPLAGSDQLASPSSFYEYGQVNVTALLATLVGGVGKENAPPGCFLGLNCYPADGSGDVTEQWLQGSLVTSNNLTQVTCPYLSTCGCASYTGTLASAPSYWSVTGTTDSVAPQQSFAVSCTTNASEAADGYLFDSTSLPFLPYQLTCQPSGVYSGTLPPASYCTSSYLAEQGPTYLCTPVYGVGTAAATVVDESCPSVFCALPSPPANGGVLLVGYNSGTRQLTTTVECGATGGAAILTGPATQTCLDGLFHPALPGSCVVFNSDPCHIVSASSATTVSCAANEMVVGGGGDCSDFDLYASGSARGGLTINQPTSDMQGWQAVCLNSNIPPLSVYATCCLADTGTFLETPAAYLAQSTLALAQSSSSFQQCERVTVASGLGFSGSTLSCPVSKQLVTSGVECPPYALLTQAVTTGNYLYFSCNTAAGYTGDVKQQALATGVCCESFQADTCTDFATDGSVTSQLLAQGQVELTCPALPDSAFDPLLLPGGPNGYVWAASLPLYLDTAVQLYNNSQLTPNGPVIDNPCRTSLTCCYVLPKEDAAPVNTATDYCAYYDPTVTNGVGNITSSTPAAPASLGATYTLNCPTPYTYVSGAAQVVCTPSGQWQGYATHGTPVTTLGTCEAISVGECVAVEARSSPAPSVCKYACGCYFDLSALASQYRPTLNPYELDGTINPNAIRLPDQDTGPYYFFVDEDGSVDNTGVYIQDFQYDLCANPLGNDYYATHQPCQYATYLGDPSIGATFPPSSGLLACLVYGENYGDNNGKTQAFTVATQPSRDPSTYLHLGSRFGVEGGVVMSIDSIQNAPMYHDRFFPDGTKACAKPTLSVKYICSYNPPSPAFVYNTTTVDACVWNVFFYSRLLCAQPAVVAGAAASSADAASLTLSCPSTPGVSYVMTQAGASCPGTSANAPSGVASSRRAVAPQVVNSQPSAIDSWTAVCYDNSLKNNLAPFYAPSIMRGLCCPTTASPLFASCSYQANSLTCADNQIAISGGGNCQTPDPVAGGTASNLLSASYNTGLRQRQLTSRMSVLDLPQLNNWTVNCGAVGNTASDVASTLTGPDVAVVCCDNIVLGQPAPLGTQPVDYTTQLSAQSLSSAQLAVSAVLAMTDPIGVLALYPGSTNNPLPNYKLQLTLRIAQTNEIGNTVYTHAVLAMQLTLSKTTQSATRLAVTSYDSAQLILSSDTECGGAVFNVQKVEGPTILYYRENSPTSTPFYYLNGLLTVHLSSGSQINYGISSTGIIGDPSQFSYSMGIVSPMVPYSTAIASVALPSTPTASIPLEQQVCYATNLPSCLPGWIQLASGVQCGKSGSEAFVQDDYPLLLGTSSIAQMSHSYACSHVPYGGPVSFYGYSQSLQFQGSLCCAAFDLCTITQPLPLYVDSSVLQLVFADSSSQTITCLAGYGFPSLVRSIQLSCDITNTGLADLVLPECSPTQCSTLLGGISPELPGGHGRLSTLIGETGDIAYVECDPGYALSASAAPSLTCTGLPGVGGSNWQPAPPTSNSQWCVLADSSLTAVSVSFPSQYAYTLSWSSFNASGLPSNSGVAPMWNLTHTLVFPAAVQLSASNAQESGVLRQQSVLLPIDTRNYTFVVDSNSQIEGAIVEYELYAYVARAVLTSSNATVPHLYNSQIVSAVVELPCGCDMAGNAPGKPQQVSLVQSLDSSNALTLRFTPQSLCTPNYQVVQRNETTQTSSSTLLPLIQGFYAQNAQSCPYLTATEAQVGQVSWQTAGQVANYCITAIPQAICTACVPIYSPGKVPPFGNGTAPDISTCASLTILYYVPISGVVATPAQYGVAAPVANVTVIAIVTDTNGSPILYYDPVSRRNVTVSATTVTDRFGQYSIVLNSTLITSQYISVTITASRVDQLYDDTPMVVSTQEVDTTVNTTTLNTSRTVTQTVTVASNTTLNATMTEVVAVVETATLTPFTVLQMPVGAPVVVDDGSYTVVDVVNTTQLGTRLNYSCPSPTVSHNLTVAPVTQVPSQSPYQMCGILRGPASNAWTVTLAAGIRTGAGLVAVNSTDRAGVPAVSAGYIVTQLVGYRLYFDAAGTLLSNVSFGATQLSNYSSNATLLYPYGSIYNAYNVSTALGVGNDQPSQLQHVLDGSGVVLTFASPVPVEGSTATTSTLTMSYDYTAGANGQYTEGDQAQQPAYSSITYAPFRFDGSGATFPLDCSVSAVLPPAAAYSPSAVTQLSGTLLAWLPFDGSAVDDQSDSAVPVAAAGQQPQSVSNATYRFGNGSLQGVGGTAASYVSLSGLSLFGTQSSLRSATVSVWVRWPVTNSSAPLQPIFSVQPPAGAPQLSLGGSYNGSALTLQFAGPTPTQRGGVAAHVSGSAPLATVSWTHVALVWDTSSAGSIKASLYINATQVATHSISSTGITGVSGTEMDVGGSFAAARLSALSFTGSMDEWMAFDAALSQPQLQQLYLYNLPYNVQPAYALGVPVRVPLPTYKACDLDAADTVTQTVLLTTTTTTTTTVVQAAAANRTSQLATSSMQQLKWTTPWSAALYAAFFQLASPGNAQPTVSLSDYRNCTQSGTGLNETAANPPCPAFESSLLSTLSLLNATSGTSVLSPFLVDASGAYLSPYALYSGAVVHGVVLPASVVNSSFADGKGRVTASPLPRSANLTQTYTKGDQLGSSTATSTLAQLSIVNSTVERTQPGTLSINSTRFVLYLTSGVNISAALSDVLAYGVLDPLTPGQTDPSWPVIVHLGPAQMSSHVYADGSIVTQTVTLDVLQLTISNTTAVMLNTSTSTTTSTTTTTINRVPVAYNYSHEIYSSSSYTRNDSTTVTATLGQPLTYQNFQDNSTVAVSGQVTFAPNVQTPGVQYCGVEGIVVQAFAPSDTTFVNPVGTSAPTGVDGMYALAVTAAQQLVLVASFGGNLTLHTFAPNNVSLTVSHTPVAGVNFQDTTTQNVVLSIVGGLCAATVGYVKPVLVLNTCGGVHIPLGAFGSYPQQYVLPAFPSASILGYTADSQDGSGLQVLTPPNSAQAAYAAQVNTWLVDNGQLQLNLSLTGANVQLNYTSDTDITLLRPSFAQLPCAEQQNDGPLLPYDVRASAQPYTVVFQLSQSYGVAGIPGVLDSSTCGNINASLIQLFVFDALSDNAGSECVSVGCALPPVYDPVSRTSSVEYTTVLGAPYIFPRYPQAPDYSRDLRYGIAGTFDEEINVLSVVVTGSEAYNGIAEIAVPPQNTPPLYIVRQPPGGMSSTTYTSTFTVTATLTTDALYSFDQNYLTMVGGGFNLEGELCALFGIGVESGLCTWTLYLNVELDYTNTVDVQRSNEFNAIDTTSISYAQSFTTTNDQYTIDGAGDAFLLIAASILESLSTTVSASVPAGAPALSQQCVVSVYDTPSAQFSPSRQLVWFDVDQIENVEIPRAQTLMTQLVTANGGSLFFPDMDSQTAYHEAANSIAAWQQLLTYKDQLGEDALPWPELVQSVDFGNATDPAVDLTSTDELGSDTVVVTFNGDEQLMSFTYIATHVEDNTSTTAGSSAVTNTIGLQSQNNGPGVDIYLNLGFTAALTTSNSYSMAVEVVHEQDVEIDIVLGDPDEYDQFTVAILKDPVYGSPVYNVLAGQSRCNAEEGTIGREDISMTLAQSVFVQVPSTARVSTTLTINQQAPFKETFDYFLNVGLETNPGGLIIEANGIPMANNVVVFKLEYGATDVQLVMYREDGSPFSYPDIALLVSSADCPPNPVPLDQYLQPFTSYALATFSIDFIPQCAAIAFAGDLSYGSGFVVNAASQGLYTFTITNPDYFSDGRSWEALQAAGVLLDIAAQYKPSAGNDAEWQALPTYNGAPFAPLDGTPLTEDYYAFTADLSQLPAGQYDFRLVADCAKPVQIVQADAGSYQSIGSIVTATVDRFGPEALTYEPGVLPGQAIPTYLPGDAISVSFTEDIVCVGTAGSLHYTALYSASEQTLKAALYGQATVSNAPLVAYCRDNTITLNFYQPDWAALSGMYVAVQVGGFTDAAGNTFEEGNPLNPNAVDFVTWGFQVGTFDVSDLVLTIPNLGLSQEVTALLSSTTVHRRLLAQFDAAVLPTAVDLSAPIASLWTAGAKASAAALFEAQLEQQLQLEVARLITAWLAASNRTVAATDFLPTQVALDNVRTRPVQFDVVLLPAAAATLTAAAAAHVFVLAMEAAVLGGPGTLSNISYPLLSLHSLRPVAGLDGTLMSPLTTAVSNVPERVAVIEEPVAASVGHVAAAVNGSSGAQYSDSSSSVSIASPAPLSFAASSSAAVWLWPALCASLAALLVLLLIAFAAQSASMRRLNKPAPAMAGQETAVPAEEVQQAESSGASELE